MAETYKTLGQSIPNAATLTTLYTVPAATSTVVSTVMICNQSAVSTTVRLSVRVAALADTPKQYILYDYPIGANDAFPITIGMTLATTDVVSCYATLATVSFNLFGTEIT